MTDDNSDAPQGENLVDMDDLDTFEQAFYNREPVATDTQVETPTEEKEVTETEDDALATEEDTDAPEDETPTEDDEPKPEKAKGKKSFQDRINELTAKAREAERREAELIRRLEQVEARKTEELPKTDEPKPLREQLPAEAPSPDALDEDGEPIYKLGEFDPKYIRDLTKFTIAEETKAAKEAKAEEEAQQKVEAQQEELKSSWLQKVEAAEEELPDIREKLASMDAAFSGIDPNYGEFLAATIMSCDNGPQLMYYLSQNIGEAQQIVAAGPAAATLALGRLDARLAKTPVAEEKRNIKKVSEAPAPADTRTRGSGGGRFGAAPDTDDLDAFEKEFYKRK